MQSVSGKAVRGAGVLDYFVSSLDRAPQNVALRVDTERWTYQHLSDLAMTWAQVVVRGSTAPPSGVGILADRTIVRYAGQLAALYAGAVVVPLSLDYPLERTR